MFIKKNTMMKKILASLACSLYLLAPLSLQAKEMISPDKAYEIAKEAYLYTYPMVENYKTIYQFSINEKGSEYKGPMNEVSNIARVFTPKDTTIVTPNSDTPYSYLITDLRAEPVVLTLPEIEENRYYSIQLVDLYTHNIDYIGTRVDGNRGGKFLLAGPDWKGTVPKGIDRVIHIPTQLGMNIYRTQLFDEKDLEVVKDIQSQFTIETLSQFLGEPQVTTKSVDYPALDANSIEDNYWSYANFLLQFAPPLVGEEVLRSRFALIGLDGQTSWSSADFSPEIISAMEKARKETHEEIALGVSKLTDSFGLFGTPEEMRGKYFERALGAMGGIYGNSVDETLYPAYMLDEEGQIFDASKYNYTLTFAKDQLPPVGAFWSLTMYDAKTRLLVENPLNRYLINSPMLPSLKVSDDGSITLYIQHEAPIESLISNWLPAPSGPMSLVMRLYLPKEAAIKGEWVAPSIQIQEKK